MRFSLVLAGIVAVVTGGYLFAQNQEPAVSSPVKLESTMEKGSYLIGHNIGSQLKGDDVDADINALIAGIKDGLSGKDSQIPAKDARTVMQAFQKAVQDKASAKAKVAGEQNAKEAKEFLAKNAKKAGVKSTPSGLQYEVITAGDGATPKATDKVRTHYKGTLLNGEVFDSSYDRGEPAEFPVNGVIKGWTEALQMMKVGSKWKLYVPPDLGYGERGAGGAIGPNAALVFEVELLGIVE